MIEQQSLGDLLFSLCVNFLLYCALIIVFYMFTRFYLEEETFSKHAPDFSGYIKIATLEEEELDEGLISNNSSPRSSPYPTPTPASQKVSQNKAHTDHELSLIKEESDDNNDGDEQDELIKQYEPLDILKEKEKLQPMSMSTSVPSVFSSSSLKRFSIPSFSIFSLFGIDDSNSLTKEQVLKNLMICAVGLNVTFVIWGLAQERILTQPYNNDYFVYSYGLVFLNRLGGLILSAYLMYYFKVSWVHSPLWEYSFPSVANMLSSWCQYEALKYVSFPTQMLAKAFKIVPVMLMGKYLYNKKYDFDEYAIAGMIGFGLYLFISSSENISLVSPSQLQTSTSSGTMVTAVESHLNWSGSGAICGMVLLILFLFFDSFTGQFQTRMFKINKTMSPIQMMFIMNAFSAVFAFITLIHQEELYASLLFVWSHHTMITHLLVFCLASTIGQLFIFYTVKKFGPVVFSIIMSCRILFSTLISSVVYSHPVTELGAIGIIIVFASIGLRTYRQIGIKPITLFPQTKQKSKLDEEDSAIEFVHEVRQHLDM